MKKSERSSGPSKSDLTRLVELLEQAKLEGNARLVKFYSDMLKKKKAGK